MEINKLQQVVVTCASGLEPILAEEIKALGITECEPLKAAVQVNCDLAAAYKICLWSRVGSRVLWKIASFEATSGDDIYKHASFMRWEKQFDVHQSFQIHTVIDQSVKDNSFFLGLKLKDAIVDRFRDKIGERPTVAKHHPDLMFHLFYDGQQATISLDLSGEPLHRRGYRVQTTDAPIKENVAAALLLSAGLDRGEIEALVDPMCGSGTFLIEAALILKHVAPGLVRQRFGFEHWQHHDQVLWDSIRKEAEQEQEKYSQNQLLIRGYDADPKAIQAALANAQKAGVDQCIHLERRDIALFEVPKRYLEVEKGFVVANPPYGERLAKDQEVQYLYQALGRALKNTIPGWKAGILSNQIELIDAVGLNTDSSIKLNNGPIRCYFRVSEVPAQQATPTVRCPLVIVDREINNDFVNRVKKNLKRIDKWVKREHVACYRIYDADMPEYNVAIDWYDGELHVQEYKAPNTIDPEKVEQRLQMVMDSLHALFGLSKNRIILKSRSRQKGKEQYRKLSDKQDRKMVYENGAWILVNLRDYLDTGLFLDHRLIRHEIQKMAHGKRFLNLFAYTCAASLHAALGGAKKTTSVDMSKVYLEWGRSNLLVNGFSDVNHQFIHTDCRKWLSSTQDQFDLIFMDPPTFSNSKRMEGVLDIQRDHVEMIELAMKRLEPGGLLIFSNNFKKFKLDVEGLAKFEVEDITPQTLSPDYQQQGKPIHQCWRIQHGPTSHIVQPKTVQPKHSPWG